MTTARPEIAVIATLPEDVRGALARRFTLADYFLEGRDAVPLEGVPAHFRVVATRALLGIPAGLRDRLPRLELVLSLGAGLEKIDVADLDRRGTAVVHTADEFTEDVADFALGLIFAAQRNIVAADRFVRSGAWESTRFMTSRRVSNRRVGIVGLGRIGLRIAQKCAALGMPVAYHSRAERPEQSFAYYASVGDLARDSDILVLACAESAETRNLIGRDVLDALGVDGIIVNVARGAVVDEEALLDALERKAIGAAALDVFAQEPGIDPRFLRLDNVILSPHAASFTHEARQAVIDRLVGAADAFFGDAGGGG
jgi:hydroxypyruvate reductase